MGLPQQPGHVLFPARTRRRRDQMIVQCCQRAVLKPAFPFDAVANFPVTDPVITNPDMTQAGGKQNSKTKQHQPMQPDR